MHVQLFTVCTELMLSVHRSDCERATQPYSSGGGVRFSQAQDQPSVTIHVRVGNRVVSHSFDVVSKMYKHIIYSHSDGVSATMLTMPLRCGYVHEDLAAM